jgi:hypothetical protein
VGRHLLKVRVGEELWRALHIESLSSGTPIYAMVNDAVVVYMALRHGDVKLILKPGVRLSLTTLSPEIIIAKPEGNRETTQAQGEAKQVSETAPTQVETNAPSFLANNPWLDIIRRRS